MANTQMYLQIKEYLGNQLDYGWTPKRVVINHWALQQLVWHAPADLTKPVGHILGIPVYLEFGLDKVFKGWTVEYD